LTVPGMLQAFKQALSPNAAATLTTAIRS